MAEWKISRIIFDVLLLVYTDRQVNLHSYVWGGRYLQEVLGGSEPHLLNDRLVCHTNSILCGFHCVKVLWFSFLAKKLSFPEDHGHVLVYYSFNSRKKRYDHYVGFSTFLPNNHQPQSASFSSEDPLEIGVVFL